MSTPDSRAPRTSSLAPRSGSDQSRAPGSKPSQTIPAGSLPVSLALLPVGSSVGSGSVTAVVEVVGSGPVVPSVGELVGEWDARQVCNLPSVADAVECEAEAHSD